MCYDISFTTKIETIRDYIPDINIESQIPITFEPRDHIQAQSFNKHPVVLFEHDHYNLDLFEWGVIPNYMDTPDKIKKGRSFMCNAQSEKVIADRSSVWHRIRSKRCLIPVTGIYEHREIKGWKKKVPYHIKLQKREMFCLPGLYHYAPLPNVETGEARGTFTIITRAANSVMAQIHNGGDNKNRMPLFLTKDLEMQWLKPGLSDEEIQSLLNYELPPEELNYRPVFSIRGKSERPDNKPKTEQYQWENLPALGEEVFIESQLF